jgi:hypothetical protein
MLTIFSTVFGFLAPFLPEVLKYFNRKQDNAHELSVMDLRLKHAAAEHLWKMEEIDAKADIAEAQAIRQPQQSFGVQVLDAAKGHGFGGWLIGPAFYLFVILDWLCGMVRPTVTYAMVAFYMAVKAALVQSATSAGVSMQAALINVWGEQDWAVLVLVLSYWFGQRAAKAAFGGSASTGKKGG